MERYGNAMQDQSAKEIDSLIRQVDLELIKLVESHAINPAKVTLFANLKVNATTKRLHIGNSMTSVPLFT